MKKLQDDVKFGIDEKVIVKIAHLYGILVGDEGIVRDIKPHNSSYLYLVDFGDKKGDSWLYAHQLGEVLKPNPVCKFNAGNEVLIKTGRYAGRKGTVWGQSTITKEYQVLVKYPGGEDQVFLLKEDLEAVEGKKDYHADFRNGQKICLPKDKKYPGRLGRITERGWDVDGKLQYYIKANSPEGGEDICVFSNEVELVKEDVEDTSRGIRLGSDHELSRRHFIVLRGIRDNGDYYAWKNKDFNDEFEELVQWHYIGRYMNNGDGDWRSELTCSGQEALTAYEKGIR